MISKGTLPVRQGPLVDPGVFHRGHASDEALQVVLGPVAPRQGGHIERRTPEIAFRGVRSRSEFVFVPHFGHHVSSQTQTTDK